jgi:hypothetical protein
MRVLKFLLSIVLALIIVWGLIISAGPFAINYLIQKNFGESLVIDDLRITPKLQLNSHKIDFNFNQSNVKKILKGSARRGTLSWEISDLKPAVTVFFGAANIENWGSSSQMSVKIMWQNWLDWSAPKLLLNFDNFDFSGLAYFRELSIQGFSSENFTKIGDINFSANGATLQSSMPANIDFVSGTLDQVDLRNLLFEQQNELDVEVNILNQEGLNVSLEGSKIKIENKYGNISFSMESDAGIFENGISRLENLKTTGEYKIISRRWIDPIRISADNFFFRELELESVNLFFDTHANKNSVVLSANIRNFELYLQDQYVGKVSNGAFTSESYFFPHEEGSKISSISSLKIASSPQLVFDLNAEAWVLERDLLDCLKRTCLFSQLAFDYVVSAANEKVIGRSTCFESDCSVKKLSHRLTSDNTAKFLEALGRTNLISPMATAYFYMQLVSGKSYGSGHELEF